MLKLKTQLDIVISTRFGYKNFFASVTSGAYTTEWGDLTTCQDGNPRNLDPSNQELTIN